MVLVAGAGCSHADHYRLHHDGQSLYAVMHESVLPGDSMVKVQGLLGPGEEAGCRALAAIERLSLSHPDHYPDGMQPHDTVLSYRFDQNAAVLLQFRDGKLINHFPEDFAKYEPFISAVSGGGGSSDAQE